MHILLGQISPGSVETEIVRGGNLSSCLVARCVINICGKTYRSLLIFFQATIDNITDFFAHFCIFYRIFRFP